MADIENQLQFATSQPQEAAQNINDSRMFNISPDNYKENKEFYATEADILKRTTNVTKSVAAYSSFSPEHTALIKNDLKPLSQIDTIFSKAKERIDDNDISQKVNALKTKFKATPDNFTDDDALNLFELENQMRDRRDHEIELPRKHDNIVNKFLETRKEVNLFDATVSAFGAGAAQQVANTAQIPSLLYDAYFYPANLLRSLRGEPEIAAPESLKNNPIAKNYTELAKNFSEQVPLMTKDISTSLANGDFGEAGQILAVQVANNIPNLATLLLTNVAAGPLAAGAIAGTTQAAGKNIESQNKGLTPTQSLPNALATGTIEMAMERIGTLGIMKNLETKLVQSFGRDSSKKILVNMFTALGSSTLGEAKEEALTSVAQDLTDYISGVNRDALTGIVPRAISSGIVGGVMGGGMTGPVAVAQAKVKFDTLQENQRKAVDILTFTDDMKNGLDLFKDTEVGKSVEASNYIKTNLEELGIKDVYIDKEAAQKFADTSEKGARLRNLIDSTGQAAAALNAPIKLKAHEFFAITMEFPELNDIYKLTPNAPNAQQAREFLESINKADMKRMDIFDKLQIPNPSMEDVKMIQEALNTEQPSAGSSDVFGESEYLDLTNMEKAITPFMSEGERTKFLADQKAARQQIVDRVNESAEFEMNQVMDIAMTELMENEKQAQLDRLADNPNFEIVDRFTNFKLLQNDPVLQSLEGFQVKEGYSPLAIDPKSLPKELKDFKTNERLKKSKVFVKGGLDLNTAASMLGVQDGVTLLNILSQTPTREEVATMRAESRRADIEQEARDQIGLNTLGIQKAYQARLTNAFETMKIMKDKFWASTKKGFKGIFFTPTIKEINYEAKNTVSKTLVGDLNLNQFKVGERKSERLAWNAITTNQIERAYINQLAVVKNIALQEQTQLATGEVNRAIRFFRKFNKPSIIQELKDAGPLYYDAAVELLEAFNLTTKKSTKDVKGSFAKYVKSMGEDGDMKIIYPDRMTDQRLELPDLTVEQVRAIKDELSRILHQAKFKNKLYKKFENIKGLQTLERIGKLVEEAAQKVFDYDPKKAQVFQESQIEFKEKVANRILKLSNQLERTQHLIKKLDNGNVNGIFNDLFWRPLVDGSNKKKDSIAKTNDHLKKLIETFGKKDWENLASEFVTIEEFKNLPTFKNGRVSKADLFAMELNFGNEGNITELEKFGVTRDIIRKVLDRELTDKHTALAQNIWNIYESFKPEMQELEKRTEGVDNVRWVEAKPFAARGKYYPGGYYPIARLTDFTKVKAKEAQGAGEMNRLNNFKQNYYGKGMTETGHLEARTGNNDFISLDLKTIGYSINQMLHDLAYRETIADAVKLLSDEKIRTEMASVIGKDGYASIVDTYINVAEEIERNYTDPFFNGIAKFTGGIQVVAIAGKLTSVAIQPLSLGVAINQMGALSGSNYVLKTMKLITDNPTGIKDIYAFAEEINPSIAKYTEDIAKNASSTLNDLIPTKKNKILDPVTKTRDMIKDGSFRMLSEVDKLNKVIVTVASFQQAMEGNAPGLEHLKGNYEESVKYASNMVELTQTSNDTRNLSPVQMNNYAKLFTLFYNDLNNLYNTTVGTSRKAIGEFKQNKGLKKLSGVASLGSFIMILTAMKIYETVIRGGKLPGDDDEEKDIEGLTKAWAAFLLKSPAESILSTIPIVRDVSYTIGRYKDGLEKGFKNPANVNIPLTSSLTDVTVSIVALTNYLSFVVGMSKEEPEMDKAQKRALWYTAGYFTQLPTGSFYNSFIKEPSDADALKKSPFDRLRELRKSIEGNPEFSDEFIQKVQELESKFNPQKIELPKENYNVLKEMISGSDTYAYNEKSGAAGIYQFTESVWDNLMQNEPKLGLTENGRVSKDTTQQQKAFEFITRQSSEILQAVGLEVNTENIYASYLLGGLKAVEVLTADDTVKISTLVDNKILTDNEIPKDMTVAEFKDWLLIKSVSADERLTKKTNK